LYRICIASKGLCLGVIMLTGNRSSRSKTFAWGGIYGSSTRIDDLEPIFADSVAAAVTGHQDIQK